MGFLTSRFHVKLLSQNISKQVALQNCQGFQLEELCEPSVRSRSALLNVEPYRSSSDHGWKKNHIELTLEMHLTYSIKTLAFFIDSQPNI